MCTVLFFFDCFSSPAKRFEMDFVKTVKIKVYF
jgi:hypothetical protein